MSHYLSLSLAFFLLLSACVAHGHSEDFDPGTVGYTVTFNGKQIEWRTFAFFVMPGRSYPLHVDLPAALSVQVHSEGGRLQAGEPQHWQWQAPQKPGPYSLTLQPEGREPVTLTLLVMVPAAQAKGGHLNGYRIGQYPDKPLRGNPLYLPPRGFIEVHPDMLELPVSPHFTLGQFLCKQQPDHWPKYLLLREPLIAKLEIILAEVNRRGIRTDTFAIMSGHRTPWYNRAIGNTSLYSRHLWGGAADIYIDNSGDGRMDDLNGDGRIDIRDAQILLDIIDDIYGTGEHQRLHGGLGLYGPRPHRGPFVHVDARGIETRWTIP